MTEVFQGIKEKFDSLKNKLSYYKICDFIFYLGIFLIPFDNLFFAPSAGWATVSPILFFIYSILKCNKIRFNFNEKHLFVFLIVMIFLCFNSLYNGVDIPSVIDTISTLILGVATYFAFSIYFNDEGHNEKIVLNILFIAYSLSFLYGIVSILHIDFIDKILLIIEKRHYDRLSFSFTEPSFISMHMYGVLLPIIYFFKEHKKEVFRLKILMILFILMAFVFKSSTRFMLDTVIVLSIYGLTKLNYKKRETYIFLLIIPIIIVLALLVLPNILGDRINNIYHYGIYADASLASRWFRINACLKGYTDDPFHFMFGYGIANSDIPFKAGYDRAYLEYIHPYKDEINSLLNQFNSQLFCMPIRIINEFGFIVFLGLMILLFKKEHIFIYIIMIFLYSQFDSYAFYTIWIYLYFAITDKGRQPYYECLYGYSSFCMEQITGS